MIHRPISSPKQPRSFASSALAIFAAVAAVCSVLVGSPSVTAAQSGEPDWAFEETFDGDPSSPSQAALPNSLEYLVTHRTHPKEHFTREMTFTADHGDDCAGPNPAVSPLPSHLVTTDQLGNSSDPDESFFLCKGHMMSSMGDVSAYSVSSFWPRQQFNFADGGVLEFDVNMNLGHGDRSWWEVMIVPADQLRVASGPLDSAIDETYPEDRIVLDFRRQARRIKVGTGEIAPNGWITNERQFNQYDFAWWSDLYRDDPALNDRRERRTMRVEILDDQIVWGIETEDGSFDEFVVDVPGGMPFDQGLVVFKTHAYHPEKDGNFDTYTFHWDNIRFDGPVIDEYDVSYASDVVYLQRNGDRPIGDTETVTVDLTAEEIANGPALFGQVHQHQHGQVLLSMNGGPNLTVDPFEFDPNGCPNGEWNDWRTFRLDLDPSMLQPGTNTLTWTVGPRPNCPTGSSLWDGFSIKALQVQSDGAGSPPPPSVPSTTVPPSTSTPTPSTTEPHPCPSGG